MRTYKTGYQSFNFRTQFRNFNCELYTSSEGIKTTLHCPLSESKLAFIVDGRYLLGEEYEFSQLVDEDLRLFESAILENESHLKR